MHINGLIHYIGGLSSWPGPQVNTVYIYNPVTNTFSQGAPMLRPRGAGGVAVYNGKIYYAGGLNNSVAVRWFDVYDPVANTWSQLPDMPRVRDHFHATVVNGKFYAIGGRNVATNATTTANDVYNFDANNNGGASGTTADFDFSAPVNCPPTAGPKARAATRARARMPSCRERSRRIGARLRRSSAFGSSTRASTECARTAGATTWSSPNRGSTLRDSDRSTEMIG